MKATLLSGLSLLVACNRVLGIEPGHVADTAQGGSTQSTLSRQTGGRVDGSTTTAPELQSDVKSIGGGHSAEGGASNSMGAGGLLIGGGSSSAGAFGEVGKSGGGVAGASAGAGAAGTNEGGAAGTSAGAGAAGTSAGAGAAGTSAGAGAAGTSAGAGAAGTSAGAGASACPTCGDRKLRVRGATHERSVGSGTDGTAAYDLCPQGHALVGMKFRSAEDDYYHTQHFVSISAICAPMLESPTNDIATGREQHLFSRGDAQFGANDQTGQCPPNSVTTGFSVAYRADPLSPTGFALTCSTLSASSRLRDARIDIGASEATGFFGDDFEQQERAAVGCPPGRVASGLYIRAGLWVDSVALICAEPFFVYPESTTCEQDIECTSGRCDSTCQPSTCVAPEGCSCELDGTVAYLLCSTPQINAAAVDACKQPGLLPARPDTALEVGWLATAMYAKGPKTFWIGAHGANDVWTWDETTVKLEKASTPRAMYPLNFWEGMDADVTTDGRNCLMMEKGRFLSWGCGEPLPFACEVAK